MSKAIYAFSGDPITFGHIDVIERAAAIFEDLIVGIGVNPSKKYLFDLEERSQMAKSTLCHLTNVTVLPFTGMLTDFAYEQNVSVIIRGLRNTDDFNFEMTFYQINENQKMNIDTVFIPTRSDMSHISSGAAKAVQLEHGIVKDYVPMLVKQQLESRVSGQVLLGVTGTIASGKSTFCTSFQSRFSVPVSHVDMDEIGREILFGLHTPVYQRIRQELKSLIGMTVNDAIDIKTIRNTIFTDKALLKKFNTLLRMPFELLLRKKLYKLKGLILIESALFAEMDFIDVVNNNMVLIGCSKNLQLERLKARGYKEERIQFKNEVQFSTNEKRTIIQNKIEKYAYGNLFEMTEDKDDSGQLKDWVSKHSQLQTL